MLGQCTTATRWDESQGSHAAPTHACRTRRSLAERDSGIAIGCELLDLLQLPSQLRRSAMSTPSLLTKMPTCRDHFQEPNDTGA